MKNDFSRQNQGRTKEEWLEPGRIGGKARRFKEDVGVHYKDPLPYVGLLLQSLDRPTSDITRFNWFALLNHGRLQFSSLIALDCLYTCIPPSILSIGLSSPWTSSSMRSRTFSPTEVSNSQDSHSGGTGCQFWMRLASTGLVCRRVAKTMHGTGFSV